MPTRDIAAGWSTPDRHTVEISAGVNTLGTNFNIPATQAGGYRMRGKECNVDAGEAYTVFASSKNDPNSIVKTAA